MYYLRPNKSELKAKIILTLKKFSFYTFDSSFFSEFSYIMPKVKLNDKH